MDEYLVPGYSVLLVHLQASPQEVLGLWREVFSLDVERLLLDIPD